MDKKIEFFKSVRKSYQAIGLDPFQSNPVPKKCNQRFLFIAFSMVHLVISSTGFLIFKAETIQEFATSFYVSISQLFVLVLFFSLGTKMDSISKQYRSYEEIIEKSKRECVFRTSKDRSKGFFAFFLNFSLGCQHARAMYIALNRKIDRMYEILVIVVAKIPIAAYAPFAVVLALINYFVFDLGAESYYLPAPMLYVLTGVLNLSTTKNV